MNKSLIMMAGVCMTMLATGCSSTEPGGGGDNRFPARANIQGAKALMVYTGTEGTRAIDGEFDRPGLYKLDADGNISMVAIYCSTDEFGNKIETEHTLSVKPMYVFPMGKDYIAMYNCDYYDEDGDPAYPPYYHLLIHKPSGNIYSIDELLNNGIGFGSETDQYFDEPSGSLLIGLGDPDQVLWRLTTSGTKATVKQLNKTKGVLPAELYESASGLIFSESHYHDDMAVLYTNGGYDYLGDMTYPELPFKYAEDPLKTFAHLNDGAIALRIYNAVELNDVELTHINLTKIKFGSHPGDVTFTEGPDIILGNNKLNAWITKCAIGNYLVFAFEYQDDSACTIIYDSNNNELSVFEPEFDLTDGAGLRLDYKAVYNNRAWALRQAKGARGAEMAWIDPAKRQSGSIDLKLEGVDIVKVEPDYNAGRVVIYGNRRSDGYDCITTLDLNTQQTETLFSAPNLSEVNLLLLSKE